MCYCLCWSLRWWHIPNNLPYLFKQTKRTLYLLCYNLRLRWPWNFLVKFPLQFLKHSWICFLVGVFKTIHITKLNYSDFIFLLGLFSWVGGGQNEIYKNWVTTNSNDWFLILHTAYNKTQKHCPLLAKENLYLIMCIKIKLLCIKTLDLNAMWQKD